MLASFPANKEDKKVKRDKFLMCLEPSTDDTYVSLNVFSVRAISIANV